MRSGAGRKRDAGVDATQVRVQRKANRRLWAYVFLVLLVSAFLCALNTALVFALTKGVEPILENYLWGQSVLKYGLAIVPALLVFAQWHAWDLLSTRRSRAS